MGEERESGVFEEVFSTSHEAGTQEATRNQQECMVSGDLRVRTAPMQLGDEPEKSEEPRPKLVTAPCKTPSRHTAATAGAVDETDELPSASPPLSSSTPEKERGTGACGGRSLLDSDSSDVQENKENNASDGGPMREDLGRQSSVASSLSSSGSFSLRIKTSAGTELDLNLQTHCSETVRKFSTDATSIALAALNLEGHSSSQSSKSLSSINEQREPNRAAIPNPTDFLQKTNKEE